MQHPKPIKRQASFQTLPTCKGGSGSTRRLAATAIAIALCAQTFCPALCSAEPDSARGPSGTLLLPLTPKIDTAPDDASAASSQAASKTTPGESSTADNQPKIKTLPGPPLRESGDEDSPIKTIAPSSTFGDGEPTQAPNSVLETAPDKFKVEADIEDDAPMDANVGVDTTLEGTIQIVADDTEYDQEKNTFLGTGNAVAIIGGQNSKLEADMILYDQTNEIIDARGNVRIIRDGQVTTGTSFKFKVSSDEYLITNPDTEINGTTIIARKGQGTQEGLRFSKGVMTLSKPFYMQKNAFFGPIGYAQDVQNKMKHPEAYLPQNPSFKFKARKIVYEKYKETGNLTVFGGKLMMGSFGVPLPKFVATINNDESLINFPITPFTGNNLQMGGMHFGPMFNYQIGRGVLSYAPALMIGGHNLNGTSTGSSIGLSGRVKYVGPRVRFNIAAGSVNHLMVADLHVNIWKKLRLQSGINRFLEDGMYGYRRARIAAELIDTHDVNNIPFLSNLRFRTSGGWYQDNPQLVNLTPAYAKLFGGTQQSSVLNSAYKVQEQITAMTNPIINFGDEKYGLKAFLFGGVSARHYSTGDSGFLGQIGPYVNANLGRVRLSANYTQSATRGSTPFVFDQFIQGQQSVGLSGDVKVNRYLSLGGSLGYNMNNKLFYQKSVTAAIGPEDFKVLLTRDMIRNINRFGFDILYGAPVPFQKLVLKGTADQGQMGGI